MSGLIGRRVRSPGGTVGVIEAVVSNEQGAILVVSVQAFTYPKNDVIRTYRTLEEWCVGGGIELLPAVDLAPTDAPAAGAAPHAPTDAAPRIEEE